MKNGHLRQEIASRSTACTPENLALSLILHGIIFLIGNIIAQKVYQAGAASANDLAQTRMSAFHPK